MNWIKTPHDHETRLMCQQNAENERRKKKEKSIWDFWDFSSGRETNKPEKNETRLTFDTVWTSHDWIIRCSVYVHSSKAEMGEARKAYFTRALVLLLISLILLASWKFQYSQHSLLLNWLIFCRFYLESNIFRSCLTLTQLIVNNRNVSRVAPNFPIKSLIYSTAYRNSNEFSFALFSFYKY